MRGHIKAADDHGWQVNPVPRAEPPQQVKIMIIVNKPSVQLLAHGCLCHLHGQHHAGAAEQGSGCNHSSWMRHSEQQARRVLANRLLTTAMCIIPQP